MFRMRPTPRVLQSLLLFSATLISFHNSAAATGPNDVVTLFVRRDADILDSRPNENYGGWFSLLLGQGDLGTWRSLVYFDMNEFSDKTHLRLVRATLKLAIDHTRINYVPCRPAKTNFELVGCSTVHTVTEAWGEGRGAFDPVTDGGVTWRYRSFPTEWATTGGSFEATPLGVRDFEQPGDRTARYELNVTQVDRLMRNPALNHGFLLRDDQNPGILDLESRDCVGQAGDRPECLDGFPPQLELEFEANSAAPTRAPTALPTLPPTRGPTGGPTNAPSPGPTGGPTDAPTASPTSGPTSTPTLNPSTGPTTTPTLVPSGTPTVAPSATPTVTASSVPTALAEPQCANFLQSLEIGNGVPFEFATIWEEEIRQLTPLYTGADPDALGTTVVVHAIVPQENAATNTALTFVTYTLCFQLPIVEGSGDDLAVDADGGVVETSRNVDDGNNTTRHNRRMLTGERSLEDFEAYMSLGPSRQQMEDTLRDEREVPVEPDTLTPAVRVNLDDPLPSSGAGARTMSCSAATAMLGLLGWFLSW